GRPHGAAAGKAEIDFRRVRLAVIGADLPRLPAGDRHVPVGDRAEDLFHVLLRIPLLLVLETEDVHVPTSSCSPHERSDMRVGIPGYRSAHPGYGCGDFTTSPRSARLRA